MQVAPIVPPPAPAPLAWHLAPPGTQLKARSLAEMRDALPELEAADRLLEANEPLKEQLMRVLHLNVRKAIAVLTGPGEPSQDDCTLIGYTIDRVKRSFAFRALVDPAPVPPRDNATLIDMLAQLVGERLANKK